MILLKLSYLQEVVQVRVRRSWNHIAALFVSASLRPSTLALRTGKCSSINNIIYSMSILLFLKFMEVDIDL